MVLTHNWGRCRPNVSYVSGLKRHCWSVLTMDQGCSAQSPQAGSENPVTPCCASTSTMVRSLINRLVLQPFKKWSLGDHLMVKILDILGRFGNHVSKDGNPMKSSHREHSDHSTVLFVLRCIFGRPSFLVGRCWAPGYVQLSCWIEEALYELTRALNDYISRIFKWSGRPKHVDVDLQGRNIP